MLKFEARHPMEYREPKYFYRNEGEVDITAVQHAPVRARRACTHIRRVELAQTIGESLEILCSVLKVRGAVVWVYDHHTKVLEQYEDLDMEGSREESGAPSETVPKPQSSQEVEWLIWVRR